MARRVALDQIGPLTKLGGGGQGVVYGAPSVSTIFAKSMVFKEYKTATLASLDVAALEAMPEFLESLPYIKGAELIGRAAWPCALVEKDAGVVGFLMPAIPDDFHIELWTAKGPSLVMAEFQHLLNEPQVLSMRFPYMAIADRQRYELLKKTASALTFFHQQGLCVGDISPKNLLFSLHPAAVYFVDCDAMRLKGVSLAAQVETPGWEAPRGEEKATVYSDRFKLGLLALRLLTQRQDGRDPAQLPSATPGELRQIITDTLSSPPDKRPTLPEWITALDLAIDASPKPHPPSPTVRKGHTPTTTLPPHPPPTAPAPPATPPSVPTPRAKSGRGWLVMSLTAVALGGLLLWGTDYARQIDPAPSTATTPPTTPSFPLVAPQTVTETATQTATETVTASPSLTRTPSSSETPSAPPFTTGTSIPPMTRSTAAQETRSPWTTVMPQQSFPAESQRWVWQGIISGSCDEGGSCGVQQRKAPYTNASRLYPNDLRDGTLLTIVCRSEGDLRSSRDRVSSSTWYRLTSGAYIPSVFILVSARDQMAPAYIPRC